MPKLHEVICKKGSQMALTLPVDRSRSDVWPIIGTDRLGRGAIFDFQESIEGVAHPVPSISAFQQASFKALFFSEMEKLEKWAAKEKWSLPQFPDLQIFV